MSTYPIHDTDTAPEGSRAILEATKKSLGAIPNLFGVFASSPAVLEGYTTLSGLLEKSTAFDETERQTLFLSISAENDCRYCVAAHSAISAAKRVSDDVVDAVRSGAPLPSPKLEALRTFALEVVRNRGWVGEEAQAAFFEAGYTQRHVLEVVLAVAFKTISNYTNHVSGTPLDSMFEAKAWEPAAV